MFKESKAVYRKKLCELLKQIRVESGLRQVELAKRLGKHQSYVSKYENGEKRLDLIEIKMFCLAIGISVRKLVERFENSVK